MTAGGTSNSTNFLSFSSSRTVTEQYQNRVNQDPKNVKKNKLKQKSKEKKIFTHIKTLKGEGGYHLRARASPKTKDTSSSIDLQELYYPSAHATLIYVHPLHTNVGN